MLSQMPFIYVHASNLQTVLYLILDAHITAIGFDWAHGAFDGGLLYGLYCCCSDLDEGV